MTAPGLRFSNSGLRLDLTPVGAASDLMEEMTDKEQPRRATEVIFAITGSQSPRSGSAHRIAKKCSSMSCSRPG
jgi:hypothetical protein